MEFFFTGFEVSEIIGEVHDAGHVGVNPMNAKGAFEWHADQLWLKGNAS
jgi:hypothetical protein